MDNFFDIFPTPYPYDVKDRISKGMRLSFDLSDELNFIFPKRKNIKNLNVLVVGCGYNEAIFRALRSPKSSFTAIDISKKAIDHHKEQIKDYNIKNLTLFELDILNFNKDKFDVIYCMDFISYQKSPSKIIRHLSSLLNNNGVILCSLDTSFYFREVDHIRNMFLDLGYSFNNADHINEAFELVKKLDPFHPSRIAILKMDKNQAKIDDFIDINEFSSRFLKPINNSFSVKEIFKLIEKTDLYFQSWYDNALYYPSINLADSFLPSFQDKLNRRDLISQWDSICSIKGPYIKHFKHTFCLSESKRNLFIFDNIFKSKNFYVALRPYQNIQSSSGSGSSFVIRSNFKKLLSTDEESICNYLSKPRTLDEIINSSKLNLEKSNIIDLLQKMYEASIVYFYEI